MISDQIQAFSWVSKVIPVIVVGTVQTGAASNQSSPTVRDADLPKC